MSEEAKTHWPLAEPQEGKPRDYDMVDSEEDLRRWPNLAPVLQDCGATVGVAFRTADSHAIGYRDRHKRLVLIVATFGMLAVLFAIVQLSPLAGLLGWVGVGEAAAALMAVVAVILGLRAAFSKKWLLDREKAERYRFLKFRFLITPELWSSATSSARQDGLRAEVESLEALDDEALNRWVKREEQVLEAASPRAPAGVDEAVLVDLIDYYQAKRLNWQKNTSTARPGTAIFGNSLPGLRLICSSS
jgi:hypothetical protein